MAVCSFNDIGEYLSSHPTMDGNAALKLDLPADDVFVREGIFMREGGQFVFTPKGLEKFIGRRFCCSTEIVHSGNVSCFGTIRGRQLYYSIFPRPNFFHLHGPEASVILGSNDADVPHDWKGRATLLSSLFTVKNESVIMVPDAVKRLFPDNAGRRAPAKTRKENPRRRHWLEYFCHRISGIQQAQDIARRTQRGKPVPVVRPRISEIVDWFKHNTPYTVSEKTIRRDIESFKKFDPRELSYQVYDMRDNLISGLWQKIDDRAYVLNPKTLADIIDTMAKIDAPAPGPFAATDAFAKTAWEDDADASGHGSSRTIVVEPALDVDKNLNSL